MTQDNSLPNGWICKTLGDVCLPPQYGWTTSAASEGGLHLLRTTDITSGDIDWNTVPYCSQEPPDIEKYLIRDGDIVISRAGSVGYSHLIKNPKPAIFASYLIRFRPFINKRFIAFFLQSPSYWQAISEKSLGIAIPNVNATKLKQIPVPVPPMPEQERIVAKIEELFTQLEAGTAALRRVQVGLKRYKASVFKAACEGRLVPQDPFDEPAEELLRRLGKSPLEGDNLPSLPKGWCWILLGDLTSLVTSGSRGWAKYYTDSGDLFLRVGNFNRLTTNIDLSEIVHVNAPDNAEGNRTRLKSNDVLITITADVGMIGIVDERIIQQWKNAYINQHIGLVRLTDTDLAFYIAYALASESLQIQFKEKQYGITKKGLNLNDLRSLQISLPPLAEQRRIVAEVERQLSVATEVEVTLEAMLARSARLRQSILKRAFEGKLVEQDSNAEPASSLLKRIEQEKQFSIKDEKHQRKIIRQREKTKLTEIKVDSAKDLHKLLLNLPGKRAEIEKLWKVSKLNIDNFYIFLNEAIKEGNIIEQREEFIVYLEAIDENRDVMD
jgi:type I restriction enzyme S subunit